MSARYSHDQAPEQGQDEFERLVNQHYAPLYRFAMSLTRSEAEACDLVQDTFVAWAKKGHQLQDRSKSKGWLFTTLHRRFLEGQRRVVRFPQVELTDSEAELPEVAPDLVARLDGQRVVELLSQVDVQYRAAVALFYLEDCSYNDIAALLDIPLGTVKSRIARGLAQLKLLVTAKRGPIPLVREDS